MLIEITTSRGARTFALSWAGALDRIIAVVAWGLRNQVFAGLLLLLTAHRLRMVMARVASLTVATDAATATAMSSEAQWLFYCLYGVTAVVGVGFVMQAWARIVAAGAALLARIRGEESDQPTP